MTSYAFFVVNEAVLYLANELLCNYRLVVDADARAAEQRALGFFLSEYIDFRRTVDEVSLLSVLDIHLFVLATLLEAVFDPAQEDEVELSDVLLVANGELVAVIIDNRGEHRRGVDVLSVGRDEITKQLLETFD